MDRVLHSERLDGRGKRLHALPERLADGCMIARGTGAYLVLDDRLQQWTAAGYAACSEGPANGWLLTPPSTLAALQAGFKPLLHPSAVFL